MPYGSCEEKTSMADPLSSCTKRINELIMTSDHEIKLGIAFSTAQQALHTVANTLNVRTTIAKICGIPKVNLPELK